MENRDNSHQNNIKKLSKLDLPYTAKRSDWGSWIYDNRRGVMVTVIVYIILAIIFVSAKIAINSSTSVDGFTVELNEPPKEPELEQEMTPQEKQMEQLNRESFNDVRNRTSNANSRLDAGLKDDRGTNASQIYDEAQAIQDKLRASREAYERGLREAQELATPKNSAKPGSSDKREDARQKGRVTVSYSLEGRTSVYLHIPAYQCQGGGEVTVSITVNRNGVVTAASVVRGGSGDDCLNDMAKKAALVSRFNISTSAPNSQQGTITYMFIPQ